MLNTLRNIIIEMRPLQWVKNLTIFTFLLFSKEFFIVSQFEIVLKAFFIFTLLTSAVYIFNDLIDLDSDTKNPEKKHRPIASGAISKPVAIVLCILFFVLSLALSFALSEYFFALCLSYALLMVAYSLYLKNLAILDALSIAGGFVIRVLAGAFVINANTLYSWIIIVTISLALLLAFGKRRSEITLLGDKSKYQRKVLAKYPVELLNSLISALVASTFLSYILLTFQTDLNTTGIQGIISANVFKLPFSLAAKNPHLLKLTIPIVFYGLARYLYIIYTKKLGGTPEKVLFTDLPLLFITVVWIVSLFLLIYVG